MRRSLFNFVVRAENSAERSANFAAVGIRLLNSRIPVDALDNAPKENFAAASLRKFGKIMWLRGQAPLSGIPLVNPSCAASD